MADRKKKDGFHPMLCGGQPTSEHQFSQSQMDAFVALCDTIFPSVSIHQSNQRVGATEQAQKSKHDTLEAYYRLSASDAGIPLEAACAMSRLLKRSQVRLIGLSLWLFSNRFGTLLLGGRYALTPTFPFVCNFSELPIEQRERILVRLSESRLQVWQEIFRFFKSFICWISFTKVDEYGRNCTFEAINYSVGEETELEVGMKAAMNKDDTGSMREAEKPNAPPKHLRERMLDARAAAERLGDEFAKMGIEPLETSGHLEKLRRHKGDGGAKSTAVAVRCDVAIVGSGAGGSVVAARLAQSGLRVIVLEKGHYFEQAEFSQLEGPSMNAMYEEGGCLVSDDSRMFLMAGSTLGGGTTINWSASFRTPSHVRHEWAHKHHLELFSSPAYDKALDAVCHRLGVQSDVAHENFQNTVLRRGCTALGYHVDNIPRNSPPDHRCGSCGLGCKQGKKQGSILTWLDDAVAVGAVVVVGCKAEEVLTMRGAKCVGQVVAGVAAHVDGKPDVKIYVQAEVVVAACGALRTPPLLRRSGLRNPAIGRNLHVHPVQMVWGYFPDGVGPEGVCYRGGIMTAYSNVASNLSTSGYGSVLECTAPQPGIIAIAIPWISGRDFKTRMQKFGRTAFLLVLTRDQGGGSVDVDSDDRLCVRYQLSDVDKENLKNGAEHGFRVLLAAGATEIGSLNNDGACFSPSSVQHSGESNPDLEGFLSDVRAKSLRKLNTLVVSAHQMGSCRMGSHPSTSAVDPSCQAWEVQGLFVADSSVFPTSSGVNPMITVQAMAYCTAQSILKHFQRRRR